MYENRNEGKELVCTYVVVTPLPPPIKRWFRRASLAPLVSDELQKCCGLFVKQVVRCLRPWINFTSFSGIIAF